VFQVPLGGRRIPDLGLLAEVVSTRLSEKRAREIRQTDNCLRFKGPGLLRLLPLPGWHLLLPIDGGEIALLNEGESVQVRYKLTYTTSIVVSSMLALLGGVILGLSFGTGAGLVTFGFGLVIGRVNITASSGRFLDWLPRSMWDAVDEVSGPRHTPSQLGGAA